MQSILINSIIYNIFTDLVILLGVTFALRSTFPAFKPWTIIVQLSLDSSSIIKLAGTALIKSGCWISNVKFTLLDNDSL